MTALPAPEPTAITEWWKVQPPLTVADFMALPADTDRDYELQEGALVVAAKPLPIHQRGGGRLFSQLDAQAPAEYAVVQDVDVNLQLKPADQPGTVRSPDLVITSTAAFDRVNDGGGVYVAEDVLLAVEIKSPSTGRIDAVLKHSEYADAGIDHYWIIDLDDGPSLTAHHLGGEFGYIDEEPVRGVFTIDVPFPARIDLTRLV